MNDFLRLFVAAALPPALNSYLAQQAQQYQHQSVRLVPPQNLHLTLLFLGNTPIAAMHDVEQKLQLAAAQHTPFELELQCVEPAPNAKVPRLVWARFRQSPEFENLVHHLRLLLSPQLHLPQKPLPHVTLARIRKGKPLPIPLPAVVAPAGIVLPVNSLALWQSELASPHPVYKQLHSFPVGKNLAPLSSV